MEFQIDYNEIVLEHDLANSMCPCKGTLTLTIFNSTIFILPCTRIFGQLAAFAANYLQATYAGLAFSLQAKWQLVCCMVSYITLAMEMVETAIWKVFLLALFGPHTPLTISNNFHCFLSHSIK